MRKTTGKTMPAISARRLRWIKAITIMLPLLILFLLEMALRVFHYGYDMRLFVPFPADERYLVLNPDASKLYFTDPAMAATGNSEPFRKEKEPGTCRIFVLGESTTIGYPYFHNGSFHRWLQYRLAHTFPGRHFEIVNLSMTAVNSYTVLGFAKEAVDYSPDAVLIYSGHNEYYGALGVASTSQLSGNRVLIRLMLALRRLRLTQLLTDAYRKVAGLFRSKEHYSGETMMQLMAADQHIAFGSTLYQRGIDQFAANTEETLKLFAAHQIPVFISNLVGNEKDLKPFVSVEADSNAAWYYTRGRESYMNGDTVRARVFLSKAVDLDGLRFRAPAAINTVIEGLCRKYPTAHLVDTRAEFEAHSGKGIIGDELILEHVHPNLEGYALMSDAFYGEMRREGFFAGQGAEAGQGLEVAQPMEMTLAQLEAGMPVMAMDSMSGAYRIAKLKRSWPFNEAAGKDSVPVVGFEEQLAYEVAFEKLRWQNAMDSLYEYSIAAGDLVKARTVMAAMTLEHPLEPAYPERAANISGKLNDLEQAAFYFRQTFELSPSFEGARTLFVLYLGFDQPREAMPFIDYAVNYAGDPRLKLVKANTAKVIKLEDAAAAMRKDAAAAMKGGMTKDAAALDRIDSTIVSLYVTMGNDAGARKRRGKLK